MSEDGTGADGGTRRVDSNLFVTVSGPPGCGASTVTAGLAEALDCGFVSGGEVFRELAEEQDKSLSQLIAEADASDELDRQLDRRLQSIAETWGAANKPFVLESRLAGWLAGNRADLRVWLDAPDEVRADRIADREETEAEMRVREVSEAGRYDSYYGIDLDDLTIYDLVVNTARWSKEDVVGIVLDAIERYDPEHDEGAYASPDIDP
jgi:cytidylate kinase